MSFYLVRTVDPRGVYLVDRAGAAAARYAAQMHLHELRQGGDKAGDGRITSVSLAVNSPAYTRALASGKPFRARRIP